MMGYNTLKSNRGMSIIELLMGQSLSLFIFGSFITGISLIANITDKTATYEQKLEYMMATRSHLSDLKKCTCVFKDQIISKSLTASSGSVDISSMDFKTFSDVSNCTESTDSIYKNIFVEKVGVNSKKLSDLATAGSNLVVANLTVDIQSQLDTRSVKANQLPLFFNVAEDSTDTTKYKITSCVGHNEDNSLKYIPVSALLNITTGENNAIWTDPAWPSTYIIPNQTHTFTVSDYPGAKLFTDIVDCRIKVGNPGNYIEGFVEFIDKNDAPLFKVKPCQLSVSNITGNTESLFGSVSLQIPLNATKIKIGMAYDQPTIDFYTRLVIHTVMFYK